MKKVNKTLSVMERLQSPTPRFFKKVKKIGLVLSGIGSALLAAPVGIPLLLSQIAGYVLTAGVIATVVASTAVEEKAIK
ncbi:MAG: hypothetical protein ABIP95_14370 [Pelobium sp.]